MVRRLLLACALLLVAPLGLAPLGFVPGGFAGELPRDVVLVEAGASQYRFEVEIADEPDERAEGLMYRQTLADNAGMLFVYSQPQPVDFWMKDTPLSLDIVFVRDDGTIARIADHTTPMSEDLIPSGEPIRAVLEVKAGIMHQLGVAVGDRLRNAKYFP